MISVRYLIALEGLITLAFWMCSLDVQRTVCSNDMHFQCAAKLAAYLRNATPLHAALHVVCGDRKACYHIATSRHISLQPFPEEWT
jgi:hypothetical protein